MAANGETYVVYGDLKIWNCLTTGFRQEPVFDDSGTDLLYYKFTVRIVGWITNISSGNALNAVVGAVPNLGGNSVGVRATGMQYVVTPRKNFEYHTGAVVDGVGNVTDKGATLLDVKPFSDPTQANNPQLKNPAGYDMNNGPKCTQFSITQVTADNLFRVEAEFEACVLICGPNTKNVANTSGVLNNRWSMEDVVDVNRFTTRTMTGKLAVMSSMVNPNIFRNMVIPQLQPGFTRDSISVGVTPDGLSLIYNVVDKEIAYSAPAPATSWTFEHTETASREGGLAKLVEVRVSLKGDRYVDHKKLISVASSICEAKITAGAFGNRCYVMSVSITDNYGDTDNSVSMIARGQRFPKGGALLGVPTPLLGVPISPADLVRSSPNYDPRLSRGARIGDSIELSGPIPIAGALVSYLQSPCSPYHEVDKAYTPPVKEKKSSTSTSVSLTIVTPESIASDGSNDYYNSAANTAIYTYYQMQSSYETTAMKAHCPLAVYNPSGPATGPTVTSAVVNLSHRMCKRRVRIKAERVGAWPELPTMPENYEDSNNIKYILLDSTDLPTQPEYTPDAKQIYTLHREYLYAMSRAPVATDVLVVGVNPYDLSKPITKYFDNGKPESQFPLE